MEKTFIFKLKEVYIDDLSLKEELIIKAINESEAWSKLGVSKGYYSLHSSQG